MQLDTICRKCNVPLLIARSYGLVGYLRVGMGTHYMDPHIVYDCWTHISV